MSNESQTRDEIQEIVHDMPVQEGIQEEPKPVAKAKAKAKAKTKIKITKGPVEPIKKEEPNKEEEPIKEEKPKNNNNLKVSAQCPDCNLNMTVHTLTYIHKTRILQSSSSRARVRTD